MFLRIPAFVSDKRHQNVVVVVPVELPSPALHTLRHKPKTLVKSNGSDSRATKSTMVQKPSMYASAVGTILISFR